MEHAISKLKALLDISRHIVFLGGAGVSTESGIPDFRSEKGIFSALERYGYPPETLLSYGFFTAEPELFYSYYRELLLYEHAKPNAAHFALAALESQGKLDAVITQNIDGLHQLAGSKNVLELHGSSLSNSCINCKHKYTINDILKQEGVPRCECGGIIRPDIILYGEQLNTSVLESAILSVKGAELLIVGGTSLSVYPAAGLLHNASCKIALINKSSTDMDDLADLVINAPIANVLKLCVEL